MLTLNFESNQFADNLPDLSVKIKEIEVLSVVLEHLSDSIKYKEENNNSASVRSYTDAVFALESNGYSLESYGLKLDNFNTIDMESISPWDIFARIFAAILVIITGFITFSTSRARITPIKLSTRKSSLRSYGDINTGAKLISELKKSLHVEDNVISLYLQGAEGIIDQAKTMFEQVGILFGKIEHGYDPDDAIKEFNKATVNLELKYTHIQVQISELHGLLVTSEEGHAIVILSKRHDLDHAELRKLDADSIIKYGKRKTDFDQTEGLGTDLKFLKVRLDGNGGDRYHITDEEYTTIWNTAVDIDKKADSFNKDIAIRLENLRGYIVKCENLEKRISEHNKANNAQFYGKVARELNDTVKALHKVLTAMMHISSIFKSSILRI